MASASISQVHRAVLRDGRIVALKVRRPEIAKVVQADLDIIKNLAQLVERRLPNPGRLPAARVWPASSSARIKRELDFSTERRTMQRCRIQFAGDPTAHIPLVVEELLDTQRDRDGVYRRGLDQRSGRASAAWTPTRPTSR